MGIEVTPKKKKPGRWKKGESGNPTGRPGGTRTLVGDFLTAKLKGNEIRGRVMPNGMSVAEAIAEQVIVNAFGGDTACIKEILIRYAPVVQIQQVEVKYADSDKMTKYTVEEIRQISEVLKDAGFNTGYDNLGPVAEIFASQTSLETGGISAGGEEPESS